MKKLFNFFYKKIYPIKYARSIGVTIGEKCRLINVSFSSEPYLIKLGDHVSATATRFETHDGGVWVLRDNHPNIDIVKPITVGNNVFFGFGAVVLPGVTIGDNVVIGAYAVVSRDIPSNSIAVGIPAKVIKTLEEYASKTVMYGDSTKHLSYIDKRKYYKEKYSF